MTPVLGMALAGLLCGGSPGKPLVLSDIGASCITVAGRAVPGLPCWLAASVEDACGLADCCCFIEGMGCPLEEGDVG